MADLNKPIIIVKRIKRVDAAEDSGGTWKIAYADFVTAMMAFFLLMWLLGSSSQGDLKGISEYFRNPLKVTLMGGPSSGNSARVIPGGGAAIDETYGQEKKGDVDKKNILQSNETPLATAEQRTENKVLTEMQEELKEAIERDSRLKDIQNQVRMEVTTEGLEVQIIDEDNKPMFQSGQSTPLPHLEAILNVLAKVLTDVPNKLSVTGHTDSAKFAGHLGYGNWELSADRANASRASMVKSGLPSDKVIKVSGLADVAPFEEDPLSAKNRRISIIVLNDASERAILRKPPIKEPDGGFTKEPKVEEPKPADRSGSVKRTFERPWQN